MGSAKTVPYWVAEIQLMEQFGWTERQLHEEVSMGMVQRIGVLNELRDKTAEFKASKPSRKPLLRR